MGGPALLNTRTGESIALPGDGSVTIGRLEENDVCIADTSVSKRHASMENDGGAWTLRDLGSKNHTYLNGEKIEIVPVRSGDCIRFGTEMFTFEKDYGLTDEHGDTVRKISSLRNTFSISDIPTDGTEFEQTRLRLEVLLSISDDLNSELGIEALLEDIVLLLRRVVPAERIMILVDNGKGFEKRAESGSVNIESAISSTVIERTRREAAPVLVGNTSEDEDLVRARSILDAGIKSVLCVPLKSRDEILGMIYMDNSGQAYTFNEKDAELAAAVAAQAGIALKNALLLEKITDDHRKRLEIERLAAIGTFAAEISHQMKNSLVPLQELGRLREVVAPDIESLKLIDSLARSAERFEEINSSIRRLACPDRIDPDWVDIPMLIEQSLFNIRSLIKKNDVELDKKYPADGRVYVDHVQMEQALSNLFTNAIEAMDGELRRLTVEVVSTGEDWKITICDTGKGMDEETAGKVFDLFFTTKHKKGGNGLGLPLVRAVILAHGGDIGIESTPGNGTTFTITLPAGETVASERAGDR